MRYAVSFCLFLSGTYVADALVRVSTETAFRAERPDNTTLEDESEELQQAALWSDVPNIQQLFLAPPMKTECPTFSATITAGMLSAALITVWVAAWPTLRYTSLGIETASDDAPPAVVQRDPTFDNCKFFVMVLVIFQHTGFAYIHDDFKTDVFQFIQFHTRVFCFLSGAVFVKPPEVRLIKSIVFNLFFPHVFWVTLIQPLGFLLRGDLLRGATVSEFCYARMTEIFTGAGLEWFLFCLIWWRILSWMLLAFKPAARLPAAIVLSMLGGYPDNSIATAPAHHVLSYLPVFVFGQLFPWKEVCTRVPKSWTNTCVGISLLICFFLFEGPLGRDFMAQIPMYDWASKPSCGNLSDGLFWMRGAFRTMLEMTKGLVFLVLVCPRTHCFITPCGQWSLYPYLLQGLMGREYQLLATITFWFGQPPQLLGLIVIVANCVFVNIFLSWTPVRNVFGLLLDPTWLTAALGQEEPAKPKDIPKDASRSS